MAAMSSIEERVKKKGIRLYSEATFLFDE